MPFAGQFPFAVVTAEAAAVQVFEAFARNLFINLDTGEVYLRSGDRTPVTRWPAKIDDTIPVHIRYVNEELDGESELIKLGTGVETRFECRLKGNYGGPLMVQQNTWALVDEDEDPHYSAVVNFGGDLLKAAVGRGTGDELEYVDLICDVEVWKEAQKISSATFEIRVHNDVSRGTGEATSAPGFLGAGYQFAWWVTGLTGGTPTDLDGQATTHLEYGKSFVLVEIGDGPPALYKYVEDWDPGVTIADGVNIIKPTDYSYEVEGVEDNIGLWVLKE